MGLFEGLNSESIITDDYIYTLIELIEIYLCRMVNQKLGHHSL